jgi:predicted DNA-binding protein
LFSVIDSESRAVYLPTMGREKQTAVRYEREIMDRLEALRGPMSTAMHKATLSDVLRTVVDTGLPHVERSYKVDPAADMSDPMKPGKRKGGGR